MIDISIKQVSRKELGQLRTISIQTFTESFASLNTKENMNTYLNFAFSQEKLQTELTNPNSAFYFAWFEDRIVGYLKINFGSAQTENQDDNALEIERIYVSKAFQGKKIGQLFLAKALELAKKMKVKHVWLGVWEKNVKAIDFYKKNGFVAFDQHPFMLGDDKQTDILMKLVL